MHTPDADVFPEQPLPPWRRAVLKVGSSLLAADGGGLSDRHAAALAGFIRASHAAGREIVLVSSGVFKVPDVDKIPEQFQTAALTPPWKR